MHKDSLGRPIKVGDIVAFVDSYSEVQHSLKVTGGLPVVKLTSCYVWLQWSSTEPLWKISPSKVFVITDQIKANRDQFPEEYI